MAPSNPKAAANKRKSTLLMAPNPFAPPASEPMPNMTSRITPPPRAASTNAQQPRVVPPPVLPSPSRSPKGSISSDENITSPTPLLSSQSPRGGLAPSATLMRETDAATPLRQSEKIAMYGASGADRSTDFVRDRHDSLTPSMSASNLESAPGSQSGHGQTRYEYLVAGNKKLLSSKEKYEFDASLWTLREVEEDDALHDPGPPPARKDRDRRIQDIANNDSLCTPRGIANVGSLLIIALVLLTTFAGVPLYTYFGRHPQTNLGAFNKGGINSTGQIPDITGFRGVIDKDTPASAMTRKGTDGADYQLVFSDEFNQDNRTFWPGDDPYWTAQDIHCTEDLEWYDPAQITTRNGALEITIERVADIRTNHNLRYKSGMLQSWNQMCFRGGYLEAGITLPGSPVIQGFWPGFWTMGNLGRPGFGATNEGNWPYSYNECDLGTLPNQTDHIKGVPAIVIANTTGMGDVYNLNALSYLPGQRLSRCTCDGEDHPGPHNNDGSYVGRSAPEIDVLEAVVRGGVGGLASQSLQLAPMDYRYIWDNTTKGTFDVYQSSQETAINGYVGGAYQQACSALTTLPSAAYELSQGEYAKYGFEYEPYDSKAVKTPYITWITNDEPNWTFRQTAGAPNKISLVGQRNIPGEPMAMVLNLGMSESFVVPDYPNLAFPAVMRVDYVRVYQRAGQQPDIGCDTKEWPSAQYIQDHLNAYMDQNFTTWASAGYTFPKNSMLAGCKVPSR